ncbi:ABC transporter substrate-binding protein [Homoserinibacter sp. YIM 151385]|uniref:ABC transporter substrate-binding protein n=1 Tax=Homoserinibacter sp. YIM 151385 TaxID=2985506 RepID=UPI0022F0E916|nr:extracellular solute-binding protein [Homoserinibacter sp. YIM 151385]WBU37447.1 extracellular solute-binding protein [Homoserinibacter sp. YIM 151385]
MKSDHISPAARRLGAVALGVTLVALPLAGCAPSSGSGDGDAGGPVTLLTWGDTKFAELQGETYNDTFPDEEIDLKVVSGGQDDADSLEKFRLALSSGQDIPDIVQLNYSSLAEFAEAGVLADLEPYVGDQLDGITNAGQELMQYDDQLLAVPYEVKTKLWFYRTDLFQEAGIDVAEVRTQDDFIAAGEKLQLVAPESYMWNLGPNPAAYNLGEILSGNGARFSEKEPECAIVVESDPGVRDGFTALKELRESGVVEPNIDDFSPEWQSGLADGTIASTLLASWFPSFLEEYAPDLAGKWGVTTWPEIGGADGGSEAAGSIFVIPADAPNKDAAARLLAGTLIDDEGAQAYVDARGGSFPSAVAAVVENAKSTPNEYFGDSLATAYEASSENYSVFPYDPASLTEAGIVQEQLVNYLAADDRDPSSFLQTAQQQIESQVGCPYSD